MKPTSKLLAPAIATAIQISCPDRDCDREDPIPATDGPFMWDKHPSTVTCPDCKQTFRVSLKVRP